jgi:hypothetical protein
MKTTTRGENLGAAAMNHGTAIVGSLKMRALLKKLQGNKRNIACKKQNLGAIIHGAALAGTMRALLKKLGNEILTCDLYNLPTPASCAFPANSF